ncbi:hypothetical protein O988_05509, partial [Pseudogymnoascus sp. VKM F-3808]
MLRDGSVCIWQEPLSLFSSSESRDDSLSVPLGARYNPLAQAISQPGLAQGPSERKVILPRTSRHYFRTFHPSLIHHEQSSSSSRIHKQVHSPDPSSCISSREPQPALSPPQQAPSSAPPPAPP